MTKYPGIKGGYTDVTQGYRYYTGDHHLKIIMSCYNKHTIDNQI